jgi:hypothetical protein
MFWLNLIKANLTFYKEKFLDKVSQHTHTNNALFKRASDLMIAVSSQMFNKLNENQKEIVNWITHKKGYIGFESYLFGEYVKDFVNEYYQDFIQPWQLEDGVYLKEYLSEYPDEYEKWIKIIKDLYQKIKKIEKDDINKFIQNHEYLAKVFSGNLKEREKGFIEIKEMLWQKIFNYLKVFCIY